MSEFECRCGNLIAPSVGYCEECGPVLGRPIRMDGKTNTQLRDEEEGYYRGRRRRNRFEDEPEEEDDDENGK